MALEVTRRMFSAGFGGVVSRLAAGPLGGGRLPVGEPLAAGPEIEDAYERLFSEYVRIEEAAIATGKTTGEGASTFVGRQLEGFIGDLDSGVDLGTRAGEIYDRFRERLRQAVERLSQEDEGAVRQADGDGNGCADRHAPEDAGEVDCESTTGREIEAEPDDGAATPSAHGRQGGAEVGVAETNWGMRSAAPIPRNTLQERTTE